MQPMMRVAVCFHAMASGATSSSLQSRAGSLIQIGTSSPDFDGHVAVPKLADRAWRDPVREPPTFHNAALEDKEAVLAHYKNVGCGDVWTGCSTDEVVPGLFLGTGADAAYWPFLSSNQITHILCVAGHIYTDTLADDPMPYSGKGVAYLRQPWGDSEEDTRSMYGEGDVGKPFGRLREATEFIADARLDGGKVLVHCVHCISSSATVVTAYLMEHWGMTFTNARDYIKQKHHIVDTHVYDDMLVHFEQFLSERPDFPGEKAVPRWMNTAVNKKATSARAYIHQENHTAAAHVDEQSLSESPDSPGEGVRLRWMNAVRKATSARDSINQEKHTAATHVDNEVLTRFEQSLSEPPDFQGEGMRLRWMNAVRKKATSARYSINQEKHTAATHVDNEVLARFEQSLSGPPDFLGEETRLRGIDRPVTKKATSRRIRPLEEPGYIQYVIFPLVALASLWLAWNFVLEIADAI